LHVGIFSSAYYAGITGITDGVTAANSVTYGYDVRGRLAQVSLAGASTAPFKRTDYVFDANGNRTAVERRVNAADASASETDLYTRTAGTNRLASLSTPAGLRSLTPDARGNLISESRPGGIAVNAGYDGHGRLVSYTRTGNPNLTHSYNGLDDRVSTTTGTDTRRFVYAPDGRVLGEYGASATDVRAEFIWMNPQVSDGGTFGGDDGLGGYMPLAVVTTGGTLSWVHGDHLGTPILMTNAAGTAIAQPTGYTPPAFPGQSKTLADLYYNRHRDYDPTTGRYIQADPIGLEGGASPYTYADGNPVNFFDPDGLEKVDLFGPNDVKYRNGVRREPNRPGICQVYGHMTPSGIDVWRNGQIVTLSNPASIKQELMKRGCKPKQPVFFLGCRAGQGGDSIAERYAKAYRVRTVGSTGYTWWRSRGFEGTYGKASACGENSCNARTDRTDPRDLSDPGQWRSFGP
jgi:RHS repeat-associated protein